MMVNKLKKIMDDPMMQSVVFRNVRRTLSGIRAVVRLARSGALGSFEDTMHALNRCWETMRRPDEPPALSTHKKITVPLLRNAARHAGLPVSGTKAELLARLKPLSMPPCTMKRVRSVLFASHVAHVAYQIQKLARLAKKNQHLMTGRLVIYQKHRCAWIVRPNELSCTPIY